MRRGGDMRQLVAVLGAVFAASAFGQAFPTRPVTMIVPYAAGGSADVVARPVAAEMGKILGENVVVELRPGAGGNIGAEYVARSARADGYTILLASLSLATNVSLMKLSFDPRRDLAAIGGITTFPNVLLVSSQDPARSLQDIVSRARTDPGKLTYGSSGPGTSSHLAGELLSVAAGIQLVHVPYKGSGAGDPGLIARRANALPDVPTVAESGFPGFEFGAWLGLFAPNGTPKEIVGRLEEAMLRSIETPEMKNRLSQLGGEPIPARAAEFWKFFNDDVERYARLVREGKVKPIQ